MIDKRAYIVSKFPYKRPTQNGEINVCCPFHDDSSPSFSINMETGMFICRSASCGLRGGFPYFYKLTENIESWTDVYKALKQTSSDFDISDIFKEKKTLKHEDIGFPPKELWESIGSLDYLTSRGLGPETVEAFGLVYGKLGKYKEAHLAGSIIAPIWDLDGSYKTFQVRYLNEKARVRWGGPTGSPIGNILYGGWLVSEGDKELWIVEGASDVWNMHTFGARAVGLNTKEASAAQLTRIYKLCTSYNLLPIICLDGDVSFLSIKAKKDFIGSLFYELSALGLSPEVVMLNPEEDPGNISYDRYGEIRRTIIK